MTGPLVDPQQSDAAVLGPVGQEIVFENDRVRVWHIRLEPGERQPLHRHDHPYLVVAVQGAKNVVQTIDGTRIDADEPTGGVVYRDPGAVHMLKIGRASCRERV